jgi:hypothetical protein
MKNISFKINLIIFILVIFFLSYSVNNSIASDNYSLFFKEIESVSTWEDLKEISIKYTDDGVFAEGFSEKTEWLFHNKYSDLFKIEIFEDKNFIVFIKRHIDQTWSYGSVENLKIKIENNCPKGYNVFCKDLLENIGKVIKDNMLDSKQEAKP